MDNDQVIDYICQNSSDKCDRDEEESNAPLVKDRNCALAVVVLPIEPTSA
jgi:hypothetical protein